MWKVNHCAAGGKLNSADFAAVEKEDSATRLQILENNLRFFDLNLNVPAYLHLFRDRNAFMT